MDEQSADGPTGNRSKAADILLSIVARKTGLDANMLHLDMDLTSDLALDSITRVEIVAALRDAVPSRAGVTAKDLVHVKTLGDVLAFF